MPRATLADWLVAGLLYLALFCTALIPVAVLLLLVKLILVN